jgi:cellulose 1,4-beta-cellobiosidase
VSSTQRLITLTWVAVTHATSYTVYKATAAASGPYTSTATGVTTTTWTSGTLAAGNYWFEIAAYQGAHWVSTNSVATSETTTSLTVPNCTQP